MAVQLPNFLNVPIQRPDYSGLSDIFENYYAGKGLKHQANMNEFQAKGAPLDLLMKQIQAEFARPNAEAALQGAKLGNQSTSLSNRQSQMTLQKLQQELSQEAKFNAAMKAAQAGQGGGAASGMGMGGGMGGGMGMGGGGMPMPMGQPPNMGAPRPNLMSNASEEPGGAEGVRQQQNGTALQEGLMKLMQHQAMKNMPMPTQAPLMNEHPEEMAQAAQTQNEPTMQRQAQSKMQEIHPGNPAEYFVDKMWDDQPEMRPFLKKKGYKDKEVKEVYDKATGATRVTTTWPSGRKTVNVIKPEQEEDTGDEIPLSKPTLVKVENETRGIDALLPYMDTLIEMSKPTYIAPGVSKTKLPAINLMPSNAGVAYRATVNKGIESFMSASTLPRTDTSIKKVESIMTRGHGEDDPTYYKRLLADKKEMLEKRAKNIKMLKKGINKYGANATANSKDESNKFDGMSDEELRAML